MKMILLFLTVSVLLTTGGCVISHDHRDRPVHDDAAQGGVDHGEHPGDLEHGDTMQK